MCRDARAGNQTGKPEPPISRIAQCGESRCFAGADTHGTFPELDNSFVGMPCLRGDLPLVQIPKFRRLTTSQFRNLGLVNGTFIHLGDCAFLSTHALAGFQRVLKARASCAKASAGARA